MARIIDDNIKRQLSKRMDFFLKYFPVRVRNVGEDAVAARQLIWDFKDARDNAFEKVAQMTATHLIQVCGEKIKDIVFVCVPASTQAKNESRYKAFCNRVSELCGIINGYPSSFAPVTPTNRAHSQYRSSACGYGYWENVPIFWGASDALYRMIWVIRMAFATP